MFIRWRIRTLPVTTGFNGRRGDLAQDAICELFDQGQVVSCYFDNYYATAKLDFEALGLFVLRQVAFVTYSVGGDLPAGGHALGADWR
jgi:hypothetical protein